MFISQGKIIELRRWHDRRFHEDTHVSCHISLSLLLQTRFFFFFFFLVLSYKLFHFFYPRIRKFLEILMMNIVTFWEKFSNFYHKIEREKKKNLYSNLFTFHDLC
jgi:hypothetical protein